MRLSLKCLLVTLVFGLLCTTLATCSCDQRVLALCAGQLGLNSSSLISVEDCPQGNPGSCVNIDYTCNSSLPDYTLYGVLCTSAGLKFYPSSDWCTVNNSIIINTTSAVCSLSGSKFNCVIDENTGLRFLSASSVNTTLHHISNCSQLLTTSAPGLKLLPNPVGPDAITAIVVLICLAITCILAGFFFWPKCHIADPAAESLKKASKQVQASFASGRHSSSDATKQCDITYDQDRKAAVGVSLGTIEGPSAA